MEPIILFRKDISNEEELKVAKKYFEVTDSRSKCKNKLVIPRYSALPFYAELEDDLKYNDSKMLNTLNQHLWIANFDYYQELKDFTFETWDEHEFPYSNDKGPFVVKGRTNSKKDRWKTHMFAPDRVSAITTASRINEDSHYGNQGILYRKYVPLKHPENGLTGIPFSNEWRFFYLGNQMLSYGYYWTVAEDTSYFKITDEAMNFAQQIAEIAAQNCNFFVIDIAEKEDGGWIVVELNDGQMSGLSDNDPDVLYGRLQRHINSHFIEKSSS